MYIVTYHLQDGFPVANLYAVAERNLDTWESVIFAADSRLEIQKVATRIGSAQTIIDIGFKA